MSEGSGASGSKTNNIPALQRFRAIVDGNVCEVKLYNPKEGRFLAQLPSKILTSVKPSSVVQLRPVLHPPAESPDSSIYAYLKTW